jgi:hypothetical protein
MLYALLMLRPFSIPAQYRHAPNRSDTAYPVVSSNSSESSVLVSRALADAVQVRKEQ